MILFTILVSILKRIIDNIKNKRLNELKAYYYPILQEALKSKDYASTLEKLIAKPGSLKFQAIEEILFELKDNFPEASKELFRRLNYVSFYENLLNDKNVISRATAIDKLGKIGVEELVDKLGLMLKSEDREIIAVTIRALSNIGTPEALLVILNHIQELFEKWLVTRKSVETALIKFGNKEATYLIQYGRNISNPKILAIILDTLSHLDNSEAFYLAMNYINHPDSEVRAKSLKVILRFPDLISEKDLEKILNLSKDPVWFVRLHVAKILGRVNGREEIINHLGNLIVDENWQVRHAAALSLSKKGQASIDLILKILKGKDRYAIETLCEEIEKAGLYHIFIDNLSKANSEASEKSKEILKIMYDYGFSTPLREYLDIGDETIKKELKLILSRRDNGDNKGTYSKF